MNSGLPALLLALAAASCAAAAEEPKTPPEPQRLVRFLAFADPHFDNVRDPYPFFRSFLADTKSLKADFVTILGDHCGAGIARELKKIAEESGVKVHFVPGNHDADKEMAAWKGVFGVHHYSWDQGGIHFVNWGCWGDGKWLAEDLGKVVPADTPVVLLTHYCPDAGLAKLVAGNGRTGLILSGDVHGGRNGMVGKVRDVNLDKFNNSGYVLVDIFPGGKSRVEWRPGPISKHLTIVHPPDGGEAPAGKGVVLVDAFDSNRLVDKLEYDDGSGWKPLAQKTPWSWTAPADLRGGEIKVRATDSAGEVWNAAGKYRAGRPAPAVKLGADWPVPGGSADNRRAAGNELAPPLALAWHAQIGGACSQPILAGGRLYVTVTTRDYEENNAVVCLDPADGKVLWRSPLGGGPRAPAAFAADVVATVDRHGRAYGFNAADGKPLWKVEGVPTYNTSSGAMGSVTAADGVFYLGNLWALEARTGRKLWSGGGCWGQAAVGGGKLAGASACLDAKTGAPAWKSAVRGYPRQAPVILGDRIFMAGQLLNLADGAVVQSPAGINSDGVAASDGKTLVWAGGPLKAFNLADGKPLWEFKGGASGPPALSGGYVYVPGGDGCLRALAAADGKEVWRFQSGSWASAPTISGNALFFSGEDGCVYALVGAPAASTAVSP